MKVPESPCEMRCKSHRAMGACVRGGRVAAPCRRGEGPSGVAPSLETAPVPPTVRASPAQSPSAPENSGHQVRLRLCQTVTQLLSQSGGPGSFRKKMGALRLCERCPFLSLVPAVGTVSGWCCLFPVSHPCSGHCVWFLSFTDASCLSCSSWKTPQPVTECTMNAVSAPPE